MIYIFWTGWGILIGVLGISALVATQLIVNTATRDDNFYSTHAWPKLLAFGFAAIVTAPTGWALNRKKIRQVMNPKTGIDQMVEQHGHHSLFFIPVQYWWVVYLVFGAIGIVLTYL